MEPKAEARKQKKRKCLICCGIASAVTFLLIILLVVLAVTLLKPKSPKISVDDVKLQAFNLSLNLLNPQLTLAFSMHVRVQNPNRASFRYSDTTSKILYHGDQVGDARIPAGRIPARGSTQFGTNVTLQALRLISNSNLVPDVASGVVPISTFTTVAGRVNVLNIFKRHATSTSACNLNISMSTRSIKDYKCTQKTKL